MKTALRVLTLALALLAARGAQSAPVGYVNIRFLTGDTLFQNALLNNDNHLSTLFGTWVPENTTVSLWNPNSMSWGVSSIFSSGVWSENFELRPGTGARLTTEAPFTNTFVGYVLNHDGSPASGSSFPPPPPFAGPNGIYLWGDRAPMAATGSAIFMNILGRHPHPGEQITRLNAATQTYLTSTYLGGEMWDVIPSINVGEAAFFNVGPVPEPSVGALGLCGLVLSRLWFRRGTGLQPVIPLTTSHK